MVDGFVRPATEQNQSCLTVRVTVSYRVSESHSVQCECDSQELISLLEDDCRLRTVSVITSSLSFSLNQS